MNVTDFTYLIKNPSKVVDPLQTKQLEDILEEYPYFQAARALHLKGLKNLNSYKYNKALKTTAAFTLDRDVLFNFITSKDFLQSKQAANTITIEEEILKNKELGNEAKYIIENSEDKPLPQDQEDANHILDPKLFTSKHPTKTASEDLQLGQPLTLLVASRCWPTTSRIPGEVLCGRPGARNDLEVPCLALHAIGNSQ